MNEQQLQALVPTLHAVLRGHDFETSVSALMSALLRLIVEERKLDDPAAFAESLGDGLVSCVKYVAVAGVKAKVQ
ncbi:MAG: hypothetical protein DI537_20675 [Stutzerimonas stutzeri]|nr:MAG: hypothetical protein DI537_20675 [Stutzerimonas stutzeri]